MDATTERKGLGQVIRTLRELNEMSRANLAEEADLGVDMIAKVEQGVKSPSARTLKRLAMALGVDAVELSQRGVEWALLLGTAAESSGALRGIATGVGVRAGSAAAGVIGTLGLTAGAFALNRLDRRQTEMALRHMLEQRLVEAQSDEELENIVSALASTSDATNPGTSG